MEEQISLTTLVSGYTANVRSLEREISTLSRDAEELTRDVEAHKEQRETTAANLARLRRTQAALESEKESLVLAFMESQLQGDVAGEQASRKRNQEITAELERTAESIRENVGSPENTDLDRRAAELAVTKSEIQKRLPKKSYEQALNNPLLQTVADTLRSDADRLRKRWNAVKVPAAPKDAVEEARRQRGVKAGTSPAFLQEQERRRKEREKEARRKSINEAERKRRGGTPAHTGTTVLADRMLEEVTQV